MILRYVFNFSRGGLLLMHSGLVQCRNCKVVDISKSENISYCMLLISGVQRDKRVLTTNFPKSGFRIKPSIPALS